MKSSSFPKPGLLGLSRRAVSPSVLTPVLFSLVLASSCRAQEEEDPAIGEEAFPEWESLQSNAQEFVEAYNAKNTAGISTLFTLDAEMEMSSGLTLKGREEIEAYYDDVFTDRPEAQAALEVDSVRFLCPSIAVEDGALHITEAAGGEPASFRYTALYALQEDGSWLIASTRDREFVAEQAGAQLEAVSALVGDWIGRSDGGTVKINNLNWDESGAFLVGTVEFLSPDIEPTRSDLRIGWDSLRKSIVSWAFGSEGGYNHGCWTKIDKEWIIKWNGYTADGELTSSTNVISPIDEVSFRWTVMDKVIGNELIPDSVAVFARQPPAPSVSAK